MPSLITEDGTSNTTTTNVDSSMLEITKTATLVNTTDSSGIGSNFTDSNSTCSNDEIHSNDFSSNADDNSNINNNNDANEKDNNTSANMSNSLLTISEVSTLDENEVCQDLEYRSHESTSTNSDQDQDDDLLCSLDNYFQPKKSCLARKSKFYIDTEACSENSSSIMDSANATSSPLIPTSPPVSPLSSLSLSSISTSSAKKRVSFADVYGKIYSIFVYEFNKYINITCVRPIGMKLLGENSFCELIFC